MCKAMQCQLQSVLEIISTKGTIINAESHRLLLELLLASARKTECTYSYLLLGSTRFAVISNTYWTETTCSQCKANLLDVATHFTSLTNHVPHTSSIALTDGMTRPTTVEAQRVWTWSRQVSADPAQDARQQLLNEYRQHPSSTTITFFSFLSFSSFMVLPGKGKTSEL